MELPSVIVALYNGTQKKKTGKTNGQIQPAEMLVGRLRGFQYNELESL